MPVYERTGMISHRHPFYGEDEEDVFIVEEPDMETEDSVLYPVPAESVETPPVVVTPDVTQIVIPETTPATVVKTTPPFAIGGAVLSIAEVSALVLLWNKTQGKKTWPWYVLAGFIGLRAIGSTVGLIESVSGNK